MKPIILLFLLSLITCKTTLDKIVCLVENEKLINELVKVVDSIKSKDFQKIISTLSLAYLNGKDEVKKCLSDEEDEPVLMNPLKLLKCQERCGDYYYDEACMKKCNEQYGYIREIDDKY